MTRMSPWRPPTFFLNRILLLLALSTLFAAFPGRAQEAPLITGVDSIEMTVSDLHRAEDFYCHVLLFTKVSEAEIASAGYARLQGVPGARVRIATLKLGGETIELVQFLNRRGRPIPADSRSNDRWFQHIAIVVSDMGKAYRWLRQNKVESASSFPQRLPDWNRDAGGIAAFYFKDLDGHPLEILQFPAEKGLPKWHQPTDKLFLGIDHTAIVVADTEASLNLYRNVLGMQVVGISENYGIEQEHLNNLFGAHLLITSLRGRVGPGIELLEYLTPRDGRPFPSDERSYDIVHRQTILITEDPDEAAQVLRTAGFRLVSPGLVVNHAKQLAYRKALKVRDPDGHVVEIEQR